MDRSLGAAAAVVLAAVVAGFAAWPRSTAPPPLMVSTAMESRQLTAHVSGAVASPGLVSLDADARVADAIAAAGGATEAADLGSVNLAAPVGDGARIAVPALTGESGSTGIVGDGRVHLNTADADQIESLPGVGPVLAARIVAFRESEGPFASVEDLLAVSGIGESKLAALRESVIVP